MRPNKESLHISYSPVLIAVTADLNNLVASNVLSRVWSYCEMKDGVCTASIDRISNDLRISYNTTLKYLKLLCDKGYLIDLTPNLRNTPHTYQDAGRVFHKPAGYVVLPQNKNTGTEPDYMED